MRRRFQASFRRVLLFHLLEIGVQAIQLFSHITRVPQRAAPYAWARPLLSWHAIVPFRFSLPGKPSDPGTSLRVPPGYAGDITERLAAQTRQMSKTIYCFSCPPAYYRGHE